MQEGCHRGFKAVQVRASQIGEMNSGRAVVASVKERCLMVGSSVGLRKGSARSDCGIAVVPLEEVSRIAGVDVTVMKVVGVSSPAFCYAASSLRCARLSL